MESTLQDVFCRPIQSECLPPHLFLFPLHSLPLNPPYPFHYDLTLDAPTDAVIVDTSLRARPMPQSSSGQLPTTIIRL